MHLFFPPASKSSRVKFGCGARAENYSFWPIRHRDIPVNLPGSGIDCLDECAPRAEEVAYYFFATTKRKRKYTFQGRDVYSRMQSLTTRLRVGIRFSEWNREPGFSLHVPQGLHHQQMHRLSPPLRPLEVRTRCGIFVYINCNALPERFLTPKKFLLKAPFFIGGEKAMCDFGLFHIGCFTLYVISKIISFFEKPCDNFSRFDEQLGGGDNSREMVGSRWMPPDATLGERRGFSFQLTFFAQMLTLLCKL